MSRSRGTFAFGTSVFLITSRASRTWTPSVGFSDRGQRPSQRTQGRVLLFQVGLYGSERRGRPPRGLDALPADGQPAGYLSRRRARTRPCPAVQRREAAVPGGLQLPGCAHGDRGVQGVHRGRAAARDDGPGTVQVPEGRVDGCGRAAPARPERGSEGPAETTCPTETVGSSEYGDLKGRLGPEML